MYQLVKYNDISELQYKGFLKAWDVKGATIVPMAARPVDHLFRQQLSKWHDDEQEDVFLQGFVPSTLYFYLDDDREIVGAIHLRHTLNEQLKLTGGHIGYGIIPSMRRKGIATQMLNDFLRLIQHQYDCVLLTCDDSNVGSIKVIENNGGKLERKVMVNQKLVRHYWINLAGDAL